MRLKSLEMIGFKSFVDRTIIHFEEGITGVVGPNGCGKSNVVDAIRWVMGEMSAKHLRGSEMQDVIFNGAETRQPMGMAQVFLTFDNAKGLAPAEYSHYSEIQIGRRLYRSGESEYFINKTPCRLKDIVDLFLGTGVGTKAYSVIEQGKIGLIVSAKPEEIRLLVEEAAGISKFKSRKEAALRKMEATRVNLARLSDLIGELSRQMNSLQRQVKKAERYQRLNDELKTREMAVAATRYRKLRLHLEELTAESQRSLETEAAASGTVAAQEAAIETKRLAVAELERQLGAVQQELYVAENDIKLHEASIQHKQQEIEAIALRRAAAGRELAEFAEKLGEFGIRLEKLHDEKVSADLAGASAADQTAEMEQEVGELRQQKTAAATLLDEARQKLSAEESLASELRARGEGIERRAADVVARLDKNRHELVGVQQRFTIALQTETEKQQEFVSVEKQAHALIEEAAALRTALECQRELLTSGEERLSELKGHLQDRNSRYQSLVEAHQSLEGYRDGIRSLLLRVREGDVKFSGIIGSIGELIDTNPEHELAVSALLGEKLQSLVVDAPEQGIEAIAFLKAGASGRGTFLPLASRRCEDRAEAPDGEGVIGKLCDLVRWEERCQALGEVLFANAVLVKDLPTALLLWKNAAERLTYVTLGGEVVDASGAISGGSEAGLSKRLIAQKRKQKELEAEIAEFRGEVAAATGEVAACRQAIDDGEARLTDMTGNAHAEEIRAVNVRSELERAAAQKGQAERDEQKIATEIAALEDEHRQQSAEGASMAARAAELAVRKEACARELEEVQKAAAFAVSHLEEKEALLTAAKVGFAEVRERVLRLEREIEQLIHLKAETELNMSRRSAEIKKGEEDVALLGRQIDAFKRELDVGLRAILMQREAKTTLQSDYDAHNSRLREMELGIRDVRKNHDETRRALHEIELKLTELRGQVQYLTDSIRERHRLDLSLVEQAYAKEDETFALEAEAKAVEELKEKLGSIGPVNLDAVKEYEELTSRHDFLAKQHADLTSSLEALERAIAKINKTSRKRFKETFDAVDEQFEQLFPKLFRGGRARLMLTDEDNLLETGVTIVASPPGKKLQSITLLSGGEKALTAVALIFSIFLIKPSPFCLLDEVDAPLDDVNVDRFNDLIRGMIAHSQFILITHNKRTMELADTLYGVTMEEAGVSRMVSVKLGAQGEAPAEQAVA